MTYQNYLPLIMSFLIDKLLTGKFNHKSLNVVKKLKIENYQHCCFPLHQISNSLTELKY